MSQSNIVCFADKPPESAEEIDYKGIEFFSNPKKAKDYARLCNEKKGKNMLKAYAISIRQITVTKLYVL